MACIGSREPVEWENPKFWGYLSPKAIENIDREVRGVRPCAGLGASLVPVIRNHLDGGFKRDFDFVLLHPDPCY